MGTRRQHDRRRGLAFEPLEPRFLLSADLVPLDASLVFDPLPPVPAVYRALQAEDAPPRVSMRFELAAPELVLVDASLPDRDRLLADFLRATGGERPVEIVVLDPNRDGIDQVGDAFASRRGLTAVHVLAHGAAGAVQLGATTLDAGVLAERAPAIGEWAPTFAAHGDLLLWGCEVGAGPEGEALLAGLARLTGADVAASSDRTGEATLGGDWTLEFATGAIEQALVPLTDAIWGGVLATQTLDWDSAAVDWPAASLGPHGFAVGGGNVTIQVAPDLLPMSTTTINNGSPDDATVDQGGLAAIEQGLYVSSSGFQPGESAAITIGFSHPGGVSNVSFTIFDIDLGTFTDEVQAAYTAAGAVALTITDRLNNDLVGPDTVRGTVGTPSTGLPDSGNANATFGFAGSGISLIILTYRNAGGVSGQSITLHDISFDPTPTASDRSVLTDEDVAYWFAPTDFGFLDVGGDVLQRVRVTQLETAGDLEWNGIDVVLDQEIDVADLGLLTFAPAPDLNGSPYAEFRFRVSDGTSYSAADYQMRIDVTPVNDAPSFTHAGNQAVGEDAGAQAVASFATAAPGGGADELGQTFSYSVTNDNNALFAVQPSIAADGTLTYTTASDAFGAATVTVSVTDSGGTANGGIATSGTQTFTISVAPIADTPAITGAMTLEDTQTASGLVISRSAADGAEVSHFKITTIAGGALFLADGVTPVADGAFITVAQGGAGLRFTPAPDSVAAGGFLVQASMAANDGGLGGGTAAATIGVTPVNDAPSFVHAGDQAVLEDAGAQTVAGFATAVPGGGADELAQTFAHSVTNDNNALFAVQPSIAADGTLTYTPAADAAGNATVTVFVTDSGGTANGGVNTSAVQTFAVAIGAVNDAPTVAAPAAIGVVEDVPSPLTGLVFADADAGASPVAATFTVPQGALSATSGGGVAVGGTATALTLTGTVGDINAFIAAGSLRYATAPHDTSPVMLTASLDDLGNAGAGGALVSAAASVTLNVTAVDDAPVFGPVTLAVDPGGTVVLTSANLSATDVDDAWASLVFFVGGLQNGFFELAGNPGVAVTSFTQGQVAAGAVRFVQTNPFAAPSYVVFVTDGTALVGPAALALTFEPLRVLPAPSAGSGWAAPPTVSFTATSLTATGDALEDFSAIRFHRPPLVPIASGGESPGAAEESRIATSVGAREGIGTKALGALPSGRRESAGDRLPTSVPNMEFAVRPVRHGEEPRKFDFALDSARAIGAALMVGTAWWAGRGAGLLSSLLASTPTWRHVDPLPILGRDRRDKPAGWGEPVAEEEKREEASATEMFRGRADDGAPT
jgi:hypothetical protein